MTQDVSIIVPCYNEAKGIGRLLEAIYLQDYPRQALEVVVADGLSTDGTVEAIREFSHNHPDLDLRVLINPARSIPSGLNRAWRAARAGIVIRLDAHSAPLPDYVSRCVNVLRTTEAANVGGQWDIQPSVSSPAGRAIAEAGSHPLGAGDARYRTGGRAGPVETVPFGAFPRPWLERVAGYDESLLTNEDYELNLRLRRAGGRVWFDPMIRSVYFARPTLAALARQYTRYGYWKGRMLARYPGSLRARQVIAPLFFLMTLVLVLLAPWYPWAGMLLALQWVAYCAALVLSGVERASRRRDVSLVWDLPAALLTIHLAWGTAFWWGIVHGLTGSGSERKSVDN